MTVAVRAGAAPATSSNPGSTDPVGGVRPVWKEE
jgi:hypothetical protein